MGDRRIRFVHESQKLGHRLMSCMCGDTACGSCGPAQGYDPVAEMVAEWIMELLGKDSESMLQSDDEIANVLTSALGQEPQYLVDAVERRAREFRSEYQSRRKQ